MSPITPQIVTMIYGSFKELYFLAQEFAKDHSLWGFLMAKAFHSAREAFDKFIGF